MAFSEKYFSQVLPTGMNTVQHYSGSGNGAIVKILNIANLTSTVQQYSIYYNPTGVSYSTTNALHYSQSIAGNETVLLETYIVVQNGASLGVQCSSATGNNLVFTSFGATL